MRQPLRKLLINTGDSGVVIFTKQPSYLLPAQTILVPPASSPPIRIISPHLYDSLTLYGTGSYSLYYIFLHQDIEKNNRDAGNNEIG